MNKNKKVIIPIIAAVLAAIVAVVVIFSVRNCNPTKKRDSIVIMTEELAGLFNPFYATTGADQDVIGMTQIGMLSTEYEYNELTGKEEVKTAYGNDHPCVVLDMKQEQNGSGETAETVYTFVLKNGITFSDGKPLTMNDVVFNMYEYLDPVYTGSSTMYSIKIKGLSQYRTQKNVSGSSSAVEEQLNKTANTLAYYRKQELIKLFTTLGKIEGSTSSYSMDEAAVKAAISTWAVTPGYQQAVATTAERATFTAEDYRKILLEDYELTLKTFKEELVSDYKAAKESFDTTTAPYKDHAKLLESDIFKFFLYEGYITPKYAEDKGKKDKTKIESFENTSIAQTYTTQEEAINRIYSDKIKNELHLVLTSWGTAGTLSTLYSAAAKDVSLRNQLGSSDQLLYPNIEGIVSLGHTTQQETVVIGEKTYNVAQEHNADGTPKNANEYDVLQITVEGTDPKAIYNFGFTVAPAHYYTADADHPNGRTIDIANNQFGVEYASSSFQSKVIQSPEHAGVPVGAGPYKATDIDNTDNPTAATFWRNNAVFFKANHNFFFAPVKAEKVRFMVVSGTNAIDSLNSGEVDYITPQFTKINSQRLDKMADDGFVTLSSWQLGYGYIGINAGKVPSLEIRKAIMSAMDISLSIEFYQPGTCKTISWPMSQVNWAYPFESDGKTDKPNGHTYTQWTGESAARTKIQGYMDAVGATEGDSRLDITFTIAGASITDHPTYPVFQRAAEILNDMGWDVDVKADSQALTKLSTGSLEVWAAAWGSTIDPDMYQVYHKNSSATSVYAWGYREILADTTTYSREYAIINQLSALIEKGRSYLDNPSRIPIYEEAMGLVLDLAVELPVYQRKTLYAYNGNTIKGLNNEVNPYTSPLDKVWELELVTQE